MGLQFLEVHEPVADVVREEALIGHSQVGPRGVASELPAARTRIIALLEELEPGEDSGAA